MKHDSSARSSEGNLDLIGALRVLRQRAPLIAMCVLITGGGGVRAVEGAAEAVHRDRAGPVPQRTARSAGCRPSGGQPDQPAAADGHESEAGDLADGLRPRPQLRSVTV